MTQNQTKLLTMLKNEPYLLGHELGFTKLTELNNEWIKEMVFGHGDYTLQAHRSSYKTTSMSIAFLLLIILLPNEKTKFFRKTDTAVKEIIRQVSLMLKNPLVGGIAKEIWGIDLKLLKDSAFEITTNLSNDPRGSAQLSASGFKSSKTGQHFDRIFTDDIVTVEDRLSKAEREATIQSYYELQNIINPTGRIFNSGTPWHKDDAFTVMPDPVKYDCYQTGLMTKEQIDEKKRQLPPSLFAANYELKHIAGEDVIFADPQTDYDDMAVMDGTSHCDAAFYGEDYTAFTILGIHDGKFYVFGKCWRKHIDSVMDEIVGWHNKYRCRKIYNELNADKGYVAKEFKKRGLRVSTYHENENKYIKIVSYLKFEWKNVFFVRGTDQEYIDQICEYNEDAAHDDCPDSLASLIRAIGRKAHRNTGSETGEGNLEFL